MRVRGTGLGFVLALATAAFAQPACAFQDARGGDPRELYRTGRYEEAARALGVPADAGSRALLVRVLLESGRYDDAVSTALDGRAPAEVPAALANAAGEALRAVGRRAEAEMLFAKAAAGGAESLEARANHALALWHRGARGDALRIFDGFIDDYNAGRARTAPELTAVGVAVSRLGRTDPQLFHDAVRAFEEAAAADARYAEPKILEGELFLARYNSTDAAALFREVLEYNPRHPRALLGLARAKAFDGSDEALALVDSSLAVNPNAPAARAFRARLLLGLEDHEAALEEAERALAVDSTSQEALAVLGAAHFLRGDSRAYDSARRRSLALDPLNADFDVTVAELASQQRRYADALRLARDAASLDSTHWGAHALTGLTALRLGDVDGARSALQTSFAGDPYNVWVKNTLDLLDTYPQYETRTGGGFELFLHGREADLLALYMLPLAEEAHAALSRRYGTQPDGTIRVEVYPSHADFSVRSVGLAGLGALGVAFGNILALDSPGARETGAFNWGSTLWHEIAHAFTLHASAHRVPRWLTEGLSVLEERRARDGWGAGASPGFLGALRADQLLPVSELNAGFVRPSYPEQIMHAYFQASLVAELIERDHGERALRDLLRAFRDGATEAEAFRRVLRVEPAAFDERFDRWVREKFARELDALGERGTFASAMREATAALEGGRLDAARQAAERAAELVPGYGAPDGPHRLVARIALAQGDSAGAVAALRRHIGAGETDWAAHLELAGLLESAGRPGEAAAVLERAMYIDPYDPAVHDRMARLYAATGEHRREVRERRAVLALDPVNRADALYRLAVALHRAGDTDAARRYVVQALEIAPGFVEAQELLLNLRDRCPKPLPAHPEIAAPDGAVAGGVAVQSERARRTGELCESGTDRLSATGQWLGPVAGVVAPARPTRDSGGAS